LEPNFTIVHHVVGSVEKPAEGNGSEEVECGFFAFFGGFVGAEFPRKGNGGFFFRIVVLRERG
jgi:hypothetical protein